MVVEPRVECLSSVTSMPSSGLFLASPYSSGSGSKARRYLANEGKVWTLFLAYIRVSELNGKPSTVGLAVFS
jgi:hypothetical protein